MKNFKLLFTLLIALSIFSACRKDSISTDIDKNPPTPQVNIESAINGFVTHTDGSPIADATVSIQNEITQTNELGFFEIKGLVNEKFAVVTVEKPGYFKQFETLTPSRTATGRTRIQMTERIVSGSVSSATGGAVSIGTASSVSFQADGFVDENGNAYTGMVSVYTSFIDPTDEDIDQIMPGNLMAVNTENEFNVLQSFGMINVELEGQSGQKLNINKPATITVDVPQSIANNAPAEIPLWYFDEETGLWKEEGFANLNGGKYVGDVAHFTYWNCDIPRGVSFISGQLFDENGTPIARVRITDLATGTSITEWTNSEGVFAGGVPNGVDLLLEVLGFCGEEVILTENIGPFSEETVDLGLFNISNNSNFSLISGTLIGCDQIPLSNGQVYFSLPNQSFMQQTFANSSGEFSALVPTCDMEEIIIKGMNLSDGFISQPLSVLPANPIEIGSLEVCTDVSGSQGEVIINVNGEQKIIDNCVVTVNNSNPGSTGYVFLYYDVLPISGDSIQYTLIMSDSNSDLNNPNFGNYFFAWGPPNSADDELHTTYTIGNFQPNFGTTTVTQVATNPGELLGINMDNVTINVRVKEPGMPAPLETYPGSNITISAVLQ